MPRRGRLTADTGGVSGPSIARMGTGRCRTRSRGRPGRTRPGGRSRAGGRADGVVDGPRQRANRATDPRRAVDWRRTGRALREDGLGRAARGDRVDQLADRHHGRVRSNVPAERGDPGQRTDREHRARCAGQPHAGRAVRPFDDTVVAWAGGAVQEGAVALAQQQRDRRNAGPERGGELEPGPGRHHRTSEQLGKRDHCPGREGITHTIQLHPP